MTGSTCDRCGKTIPLLFNNRIYISLTSINDEHYDKKVLRFHNKHGDFNHPDLCNNCVKSLRKWFNEER